MERQRGMLFLLFFADWQKASRQASHQRDPLARKRKEMLKEGRGMSGG